MKIPLIDEIGVLPDHIVAHFYYFKFDFSMAVTASVLKCSIARVSYLLQLWRNDIHGNTQIEEMLYKKYIKNRKYEE